MPTSHRPFPSHEKNNFAVRSENQKLLLTYTNNRVNLKELTLRIDEEYLGYRPRWTSTGTDDGLQPWTVHNAWSGTRDYGNVTLRGGNIPSPSERDLEKIPYNTVIVNSTSDPADDDINFLDNIVSFREAIFIASYLEKMGHGYTTKIVFADSPLEGSTNSSDLPPWVIELTRPLPTIDKTHLIVNEGNSVPSVIFTPAKDKGGNPLVLYNNLWEISDPIFWEQQTRVPHGPNDPKPPVPGYAGTTGSLALNRVSFSGFNFHNYFQENITSGGTPTGRVVYQMTENYVIAVTAEKDIRERENLRLKNVTFQNIKTKPNPAYDLQQNAPKSNIILSHPPSDLYLENIYLKNNSAESANSKDPNFPGKNEFDPTIIAVRWDNTKNNYLQIYNSYLVIEDKKIPAKVVVDPLRRPSFIVSENKESTRNTTPVTEAKSYIYKDSVAHLTPELPYILNPDLPDIIAVRYDRPTKGDITLFSDFSKLVEQVKTVTDDLNKLTIEVVETSEAGTDSSVWQNQIDQETAELAQARLKAEHDKKYAWVNFGVSLLSSVVGLDIKGAVPAGGDPDKRGGYGKLRSKWSTRAALYDRGVVGSATTTAMGAFSAFAGPVMAGINLGNQINQVDEALEAKEKETEAKIQELEQFREQAEKNLKRVQEITDSNTIKMKDFENGVYTPSVNLSTNQFKTQRLVIEIQDFEFGLDTLVIPQPGLNTITTFEDFSSGNKGGFRVKITDRDRSENEFVVADVYVSDYNPLIDYGKAARQALLDRPLDSQITPELPYKLTSNLPVVGGSLPPISQTKLTLNIDLPLHAEITVDRSQVNNDNSVLMTTYGNSGHDLIKGTDGKEIFSGQEGNDTFHPYLGEDTIYGGTGIDAVVFDVQSPVHLTSVSASDQGTSAYVQAKHQNTDVIIEDLKNSITGESAYSSKYSLPFDSKLYSIETFVVTPFSIVDLSNLSKLEDNERYKTVITAGVRFKGTDFDDVIDFNFPAGDINGYLKHESSFTPAGGPLHAIIDGRDGFNTLNLQSEDLNGYDYRIEYGSSSKREGKILLNSGGVHARPLVEFKNIDKITPSTIQEVSSGDVIDIPLNDHDADYTVNLDEFDDSSDGSIEISQGLQGKIVVAGTGVDAAIYEHLVPLRLTAISPQSDFGSYVKVEQYQESGIDLYDNGKLQVKSDYLQAFETFSVSPYSYLNMQNLPSLSSGKSYKYEIGPGVKLLGSDSGEMINFIFPEDPITNYLGSSGSKLIPSSGPKPAVIDGGDGPTVLSLSQQNIPSGWEYAVSYNEDFLSGVVSLISDQGESFEIINFSDVGTINYELNGVLRPVVMGWTNDEYLLPFVE